MESLLYFALGMCLLSAVIVALAWAWASSQMHHGKDEAASDVLKDSAAAQRRAAEAAQKAREEDSKYL